MRQFLVTLEVPEGVQVAAMREYLYDAIGTMKGSYNPANPIFDLDADSIKISAFDARVYRHYKEPSNA